MFSFSKRPRIASQLAFVKNKWLGLRNQSDAALREASQGLKELAMMGDPPAKLMCEAYALGCEASRRTLGMEFYDVQILGGLHLAGRKVIEMETGQGKSLTATLPLYLYSLYGQGSHLATSNDYLVQRDAEMMRPMFALLGTSCGYVVDGMTDPQRREGYACDITYATAPELGFDFLRDRMKRRAVDESGMQSVEFQTVCRDLFFILADEADALMIDEANTPLVIGARGVISEQKQELYQWATGVAPAAIEKRHFRFDLRERKVELLPDGRRWIRQRMQDDPLRCSSILEIYEKVERAISVHRDFHRDQQYIVRDGEIVLINEATGRLGEGRQWQDGIHQAIQSAEQLPITAPTTHAAKITVQSLFLSYRYLAGMTGTAIAASKELKKVYQTQVVRIPPRHRSLRRSLPTLYFADEVDKWNAIVAEIKQFRDRGRCVLIGTRSVEKSMLLSDLLDQAGVPHQVLNARHHASEAAIISQAGEAAKVTVATSMAGRGTDIKVPEDVAGVGGLHVILSEYHDSPRQDKQLSGRCARQGQPGTYRLFLSLDDAILDQTFGATAAEKHRNQRDGNQAALLAAAQRQLENRQRQQRLTALYHEKRRLRSLWDMGRDPLLDAM